MNYNIISGKLFSNNLTKKLAINYEGVRDLKYKYVQTNYFATTSNNAIDFLTDHVYVSSLFDVNRVLFINNNIYTKLIDYYNSYMVLLYEINPTDNKLNNLIAIFNDPFYEDLMNMFATDRQSKMISNMLEYLQNKNILCNGYVIYDIKGYHNIFKYNAVTQERLVNEYNNNIKTIPELIPKNKSILISGINNIQLNQAAILASRVGKYKHLSLNTINFKPTVPILYSYDGNQCYSLSAFYLLFSPINLLKDIYRMIASDFDQRINESKSTFDKSTFPYNSMSHIFKEYIYMFTRFDEIRTLIKNSSPTGIYNPINITSIMNLFVYYYKFKKTQQQDPGQIIDIILSELKVYHMDIFKLFESVYETKIDCIDNPSKSVVTETNNYSIFIEPNNYQSVNINGISYISYSIQSSLQNLTYLTNTICPICGKKNIDRHIRKSDRYLPSTKNKILILELSILTNNNIYKVNYKESFGNADYILRAGIYHLGTVTKTSSFGHYQSIIFNDESQLAYLMKADVTDIIIKDTIDAIYDIDAGCFELKNAKYLLYELIE